MNNKGFTLIETLVVIALLAAVSVTVGVSMSGMLNRQNNNKLTDYRETIENAACVYAENNNVKSDSTVTIKELIENGLLKKNLTNPATKKNIMDYENDVVNINWQNNERNCSYNAS